jgi:hypothetical protein
MTPLQPGRSAVSHSPTLGFADAQRVQEVEIGPQPVQTDSAAVVRRRPLTHSGLPSRRCLSLVYSFDTATRLPISRKQIVGV